MVVVRDKINLEPSPINLSFWGSRLWHDNKTFTAESCQVFDLSTSFLLSKVEFQHKVDLGCVLSVLPAQRLCFKGLFVIYATNFTKHIKLFGRSETFVVYAYLHVYLPSYVYNLLYGWLPLISYIFVFLLLLKLTSYSHPPIHPSPVLGLGAYSYWRLLAMLLALELNIKKWLFQVIYALQMELKW